MKPVYYTDALPGTGGLIKAIPEDFVVEELPAYAPSGEGQHLFLTVEKRGITTQQMVDRVAAALGLDPRSVGVAGQKDRQAISRQLISVEYPDIQHAANLVVDGARVIAAARHGNKLRTGHLRGNRFTITIRGVKPGADRLARAVLDRLIESWVPNRFGLQRFGARGDNADEGRALLEGKLRVHDRWKRRLLLSAYQSKLFNRFLDERIDEGLLHRVIEGEVLQRTGTGGLFQCEPRDLAYAQSRLETRQIVPTGPMFGHSMFRPIEGSVAWAREQRILDGEALTLEAWKPFGKLTEGTRRPLVVRIEGTTVKQEEDRLIVGFALPSGSYATVVLDEIIKPEGPRQEDPLPAADGSRQPDRAAGESNEAADAPDGDEP